MVQGKIAEVEFSARRAADGRHPPFITTVTLPADHPALPEGTLLFEGATAGTAILNATTTTGSGENAVTTDNAPIGVLESAVEANDGTGNIVLHGSVPADILVTVDEDGDETPATAAQIKALRGIGIYV